MKDNGTLSGGGILIECNAGVFDGIRLDEKGNIWASTAEGIHCYAPDGILLGKILLPERASNLCFGGAKRNRLFITATASIYSLLLPIAGPKIF